MKKSTLITTIAMIVVVVVALSTATYAWFSSATETTAETTISTEAASGWMLYGGVNAAGTVAYSSTNALDWTMPQGLYSPTELISTALDSRTAQAGVSSLANFYTATITDGVRKSDTAASTSLIEPRFIRVINNNGQDKTLDLTIYIFVPSGSTDSYYRAAAGFQTYIYANGVYANSNYSTATFHTDYGYGALTSVLSTDESVMYYKATQDGTATTGATAKDVNVTDTPVSVDAAIADTGFANVTNNMETTYNATTGGKYCSITFSIGVVKNQTAVNLAIYAWLDGWKLDDTARGVTNLPIVFSFYSHGEEFAG